MAIGNRATDPEQLVALARALVLAEESLPGWNGGSVSGIIWVFREYEKRSPGNASELADWILQHSTNQYVPYGVSRAGARSVVEFDAYRKAKEIRRIQSGNHAEAQQRCKVIREKVTRRHQQESVTLQGAKAHVRQALLDELNKLTKAERLEHIAWDDKHDLTFYPDDYAHVTPAEFNSLDEITRQQLTSKLKVRREGCWAQLLADLAKR